MTITSSTSHQHTHVASEISLAISEFACSDDPVSVLENWRSNGFIQRHIPELSELWGPNGDQDRRWHPEGNVWIHTLRVVGGVAHIKDLSVRLAALFHDIAKPLTIKRYDNGGISNHGHDQVGAEMFRESTGPRLELDRATIEEIAWMIDLHMTMQEINIPEKVSEEKKLEILSDPRAIKLIELHRADATGTDLDPKLQRNNYQYCLNYRAECNL